MGESATFDIAWWPALNATLNATSAVFLFIGWRFIRRKEIEKHKFCMLSACKVSALFLVSYLTMHSIYGFTRFQGVGTIRTVYFVILRSHTTLALVVFVLAIYVLRKALKGEIERHRRMARITLPLWFYVSVTGVIVYFMLYWL